MSLRQAIFVSLIGVALSATTTSPTPTSVMGSTTPISSAPSFQLSAASSTLPITLAASTKQNHKSSTSSTRSPILTALPSSTTATSAPTSAPTSSTSPLPPSTVTITVGESGLTFTPNTVSAAVGDLLVFSFYPRNHSVALGSWDKACAPAPNGFFSGFIPVADEESGLATFRVTVHTSEPFVFYCTASRHCQDGMYGVVNPATTYNSSETSHHNLITYAAMARNASHNTSPPAVMGGTLAFNGTTVNGTTDGTICGGNSANITSASTWCFPFIPDISSSAAALERSLWVAVTVALAVCFL